MPGKLINSSAFYQDNDFNYVCLPTSIELLFIKALLLQLNYIIHEIFLYFLFDTESLQSNNKSVNFSADFIEKKQEISMANVDANVDV